MRDKDNPREEPLPQHLAWLACAVDGEGSIMIVRVNVRPPYQQTRHYLRVSVSNTSKAFIRELHRLWPGFNSTSGRDASRDGRYKTQYMWYGTSRAAAEFLIAIRPYLVIKRRQARMGLAFQREMPAVGGHTNRLTPAILERRERYYRLMRKLNSKGAPATTERRGVLTQDEATV